ncbi:MAG: LacI family DNA-binding transcriptional regulator [Leifsonia sp.]
MQNDDVDRDEVRSSGAPPGVLRRQPTIQDVAKVAGVSVATVSRVLNGSPKVVEATRERVQAAIDKLAYSPSWLARDLRQERTGRVLVLFPSMHSPVMSDVFRGIDEVARSLDYFPLICPTAKDHHRELEILALLSNRIVDGVLFFGTTLSARELNSLASKHPVVQCAEWLEGTATSGASIDDYRAAADLTKFLIASGHRSIGVFTNRQEFSGRLREKGYRDAMAAAEISVDERFVLEGDYEFESGRSRLRHLVEAGSLPTALVCISDVVAAGAITEARVLHVRVPEDIAIAGFDDSREALMTVPTITTIRQPFLEIGRTAMRALLDEIAGQTPARQPKVTLLPHELIVRDSTRRPIG